MNAIYLYTAIDCRRLIGAVDKLTTHIVRGGERGRKKNGETKREKGREKGHRNVGHVAKLMINVHERRLFGDMYAPLLCHVCFSFRFFSLPYTSIVRLLSLYPFALSLSLSLSGAQILFSLAFITHTHTSQGYIGYNGDTQHTQRTHTHNSDLFLCLCVCQPSLLRTRKSCLSLSFSFTLELLWHGQVIKLSKQQRH